MNKQTRSFSNRIKKATYDQLDDQRSTFLNLENAEPNLGKPENLDEPSVQPKPQLDHVLVARQDGIKQWSQRPVGLKIDGALSKITHRYSLAPGVEPLMCYFLFSTDSNLMRRNTVGSTRLCDGNFRFLPTGLFAHVIGQVIFRRVKCSLCRI